MFYKTVAEGGIWPSQYWKQRAISLSAWSSQGATLIDTPAHKYALQEAVPLFLLIPWDFLGINQQSPSGPLAMAALSCLRERL